MKKAHKVNMSVVEKESFEKMLKEMKSAKEAHIEWHSDLSLKYDSRCYYLHNRLVFRISNLSDKPVYEVHFKNYQEGMKSK